MRRRKLMLEVPHSQVQVQVQCRAGQTQRKAARSHRRTRGAQRRNLGSLEVNDHPGWHKWRVSTSALLDFLWATKSFLNPAHLFAHTHQTTFQHNTHSSSGYLTVPLLPPLQPAFSTTTGSARSLLHEQPQSWLTRVLRTCLRVSEDEGFALAALRRRRHQYAAANAAKAQRKSQTDAASAD